ncbi:MAG: methyltransferase [Bacteroidetes bacterium]|nr:methyltransferase [Bacteroidota bacterium]
MKVGTDGVLLGAWAHIENANRILDVGTGTGLIALMLAQRQPTATIDAIEIEENACQQACENVANSKWHNRISIFHTSLQNFELFGKYDLIVSNPPFFSQSLQNPDSAKTTARHNDTLLPMELAQHAKRLLQENGRIAVIYPVHEAHVFLNAAQETGFFPRRITHVIPSIGKKAKRMLVELQLTPCDLIETELCIEKELRHTYTQEYIDLTRDFYLKFEKPSSTL